MEFKEAKDIYAEEEKVEYRRKRIIKPKCKFCEFSAKKYTFKKRRNFPHGRNASGKITLICNRCGEIQ